ncbi:hypothetical protein G6355_12195 [Vibrio cholerae]|nr:hypothetical protein [Vibrio cholerae]KFE28817.1 hypothetical protein DN30_456 [Vibrio cholerae]MBY4641827.1 hypothetical protein [Vibrio cholerae]MCR9658099.1 hypothetical protein [Vibrio cholerae]MCR9688780.1 hypothetical protein [Vibrio cholerae]MCR9737288.1 hypothetical protein [Vibrio cholerae]
MTFLDLVTFVMDRGGGFGCVLFVVLLLRVRVQVTWTRGVDFRVTVRF